MAGTRDEDGEARFGRGAAVLSLGIGASGALTYVYFVLASHQLDSAQYGLLVTMWSVLFVSIVTLYRPVEQFVSRSVAIADERSQPSFGLLQVAASLQLLLAIGYVVIVLLLRGPIEDGLLSGDSNLYAILLVAAPAYAVSFFARGYLAGRGYFAIYGAMLLLESTSRLATALVVSVSILTAVSVIEFGILLAPLMSLLAVPLLFLGTVRPSRHRRDPVGEEPESPVGAGMPIDEGGRFVGSAFLIMLSEQAILNAGVLIISVSLNAAAAGVLFNILLVARAPQVLFGAVTTSLLPSLSRLWAAQSEVGRDQFDRQIRVTLVSIASFAGLVVAVMALAGTELMDMIFGGDPEYERLGLVIVAVGMGFHLSALTLTQASLARGQALAAASRWIGAAVTFLVASLLIPIDAVEAVEVAYAATAALLCALLAGIRPHTGFG